MLVNTTNLMPASVCDRVVHQVTKPVENFICTKPCLCSPRKRKPQKSKISLDLFTFVFLTSSVVKLL